MVSSLHPSGIPKGAEEGIFALHKLYELLLVLAQNEISYIEDNAFSGLKS